MEACLLAKWNEAQGVPCPGLGAIVERSLGRGLGLCLTESLWFGACSWGGVLCVPCSHCLQLGNRTKKPRTQAHRNQGRMPLPPIMLHQHLPLTT